MKKSIRNSVFETNSSSVHSLTVKTKVDGVNEHKLVDKQNQLHPVVFYQTGYNTTHDGSEWFAYTFDEKAALLILYLNYTRISHDIFNTILVEKSFEYVKGRLPYSDIIIKDDYICYFSDRGELAFDFYVLDSDQTFEEIKKQLLDPFLAVIEDDTKYIISIQEEE